MPSYGNAVDSVMSIRPESSIISEVGLTVEHFVIRAITASDEPSMAELLEKLWGSRNVVTRGVIYDAGKLPGFLAVEGDIVVGLLTLRYNGRECEVITVDALVERKGIGAALLAAAQREARNHGCARMWLITTNDNLGAFAFYQKQGMRMSAVYPDAVTAARKLKPQIPLIAENGILIRDEVEFETQLV
jgi:ribosomal protein S18 acetylase RimI-like enzyme